MRRPLTEAERQERRAHMVRAWAEGKFADRRKGMHPKAWTAEQNRALEALLGTRPIEEVVQALNRQFKTTRTVAAVTNQVKRLGLSRWVQGLGMMEMERVFGVDHRVIVKHWVTPGQLTARRWSGRGPNQGWWFEPSEVERFIRECGWLVDVARMPKGHPLTRLAETAQRADPWLVGQEEIGRVLGISPSQVKKWMTRGLIPHRRRPVAGSGGALCVRGRDAFAIKAAIDEARGNAIAARRAEFTAQAQARSAVALARAREYEDRIGGECRNGHPRTVDTTLITRSGKVQCRQCRAEWRRATPNERRRRQGPLRYRLRIVSRRRALSRVADPARIVEVAS